MFHERENLNAHSKLQYKRLILVWMCTRLFTDFEYIYFSEYFNTSVLLFLYNIIIPNYHPNLGITDNENCSVNYQWHTNSPDCWHIKLHAVVGYWHNYPHSGHPTNWIQPMPPFEGQSKRNWGQKWAARKASDSSDWPCEMASVRNVKGHRSEMAFSTQCLGPWLSRQWSSGPAGCTWVPRLHTACWRWRKRAGPGFPAPPGSERRRWTRGSRQNAWNGKVGMESNVKGMHCIREYNEGSFCLTFHLLYLIPYRLPGPTCQPPDYQDSPGMGRSYLVYNGQLAVTEVFWWGELQQLQGGEKGGEQRHLCNRRGGGGGHHTNSGKGQ